LRNVKSHQCIGCVNRSGYLVTAMFPYTADRSRELVWKFLDGSKLYNVYHGEYLGKILPPASRAHVRGLLQMTDDVNKAKDVRFDVVQTAWSFNTSSKTAIRANNEGLLEIHPKSKISWAPYFGKTFYIELVCILCF
jgi:hypothetical protein